MKYLSQMSRESKMFYGKALMIGGATLLLAGLTFLTPSISTHRIYPIGIVLVIIGGVFLAYGYKLNNDGRREQKI